MTKLSDITFTANNLRMDAEAVKTVFNLMASEYVDPMDCDAVIARSKEAFQTVAYVVADYLLKVAEQAAALQKMCDTYMFEQKEAGA